MTIDYKWIFYVENDNTSCYVVMKPYSLINKQMIRKEETVEKKKMNRIITICVDCIQVYGEIIS